MVSLAMEFTFPQERQTIIIHHTNTREMTTVIQAKKERFKVEI